MDSGTFVRGGFDFEGEGLQEASPLAKFFPKKDCFQDFK